MPKTLSVVVTGTIDQVNYTSTVTGVGDAEVEASPTIPAAKGGTLPTRTDNTNGTLTMNAGHGFTTAAKIDLFWAGGSRRAVVCGTVATNSVPISGGSGDNLPAAATAITAMVPVSLPLVVTGDNVDAVAIKSPVAGYVVFVDNAGTPAEIAAGTYKLAANAGIVWVAGLGTTNPLATKTTSAVKFSHGSASDQVMQARVLY